MSFHTHYWVKPKPGADFLRMSDVFQNLQSAFPRHQFDPEKGRVDTENRLAICMKYGAPQEVLESYRYPGVYCHLFDDVDPEIQIEFMVWPLQAIGVTFATADHEAEAIHLLERLALSIGYDFELDPDAG